jgi:hypothetical protein
MAMLDRLIRTALRAAVRRRGSAFLAEILDGPDTSFRSELIEVGYRHR